VGAGLASSYVRVFAAATVLAVSFFIIPSRTTVFAHNAVDAAQTRGR
jgi:hypothetical protein